MKINLRAPIAAVAIAVGLVVLLGYFLDFAPFGVLRRVFLRWAVILAAVALLVGVANLVTVHWRKITTRQSGGFYSVILLISLLITVVVGAVFSPTGTWSLWIFNNIQVPIENSLMALLAIVLAYASARMLSRRINLFSLLFVITALVVLIGSASLTGMEMPILDETRSWIQQVPAVAGARGILLGVVLGTIATGLRVLMGVDRPYGG